MAWVNELRITLLISLSVLFLAMLYRRFKRNTMARDVPAPLHAELTGLQVMYHPERLRVEVLLPGEQELHPAMLNMEHEPLQRWPSAIKGKGTHVFEFPIGLVGDGEYYFELATSSQRTVRKFRLQRA